MSHGRMVLGMALAASLVLPFAGCGKVRLDVARMCRAHGGTYSTASQQCTYPASTRSAKEFCEQQGGYFDPAAQYCEIGRD
jgi:hypothetical protein